jgi:hypothetical protein
LRPGELWGRRSVALGIALIAIALIGGIILLIAGDGDDSSSEPGGSNLQNQLLDRTVVNTEGGISVRRPANWAVRKQHGVINIQSEDRCLVMQLSAPVPADRANGLRRDGIKLLKSTYENVNVQSASASSLGGVPTTTNVLSFKDRKGHQIRALLSVGKGQKNAYLTEVVVRDQGCQGDLQVANLMLSTLQYTK